MPKFLSRENGHGVPANALWVTNGLVQLFLIITLVSNATYQALISLATSMILIPYLFSAVYATRVAIAGENYANGDPARGHDVLIGALASVYCCWLLAAVCGRPEVSAAIRGALRTRRRPVWLGEARTARAPVQAVRSRHFGRARRAGCHCRLAAVERQARSVTDKESIMGFGVLSEVGTLRKVLVCKPGLAQARLTPLNCRELLFDDVLWVAQAKNDQYAFVNAMQDHGIEVLDTHDLLADILRGREARDWVLERKVSPGTGDAELSAQLRPWLDDMKPEELALRLIGGIVRGELPFEPAGLLARCVDHAGFLCRRCPMRYSHATTVAGSTRAWCSVRCTGRPAGRRHC